MDRNGRSEGLRVESRMASIRLSLWRETGRGTEAGREVFVEAQCRSPCPNPPLLIVAIQICILSEMHRIRDSA